MRELVSAIYRMGVAVAFGSMMAACEGGAENSGASGPEQCASDNDCKGDRVCDDGQCVAPSPPSGGSGPGCSDVDESCSDTGCCNDSDATCVAYGGAVGTMCGSVCEYGSQCKSGCCAGLQEGGGVCAPMEYCDWKVPCDAANYCASDICIGWCSDTCSNSNDCASDGWCYATSGGGQYCYPECSTDADCSMYPGAVCELYETVDGYDVWTCG